MAAPRKKPVVKKAPVKKAPVKKKPSFLRKDTPRPARDVKPGDLRSQTLTNDNKPRPAKDLNKGGLRAQYLKGANASGGSAVARGLIKKIPVVGAALGFIADAAPAGEGSTKDKYSTLKKKYSSAIGPNRPSETKKSSGFGKRISEGAKFERLRASRAALATKSSGGTQNRPTTTRPKPMNTLAADYAAMQQGQAKAKSAAPKPTPKPRPSQVVPSAPVKRGGLLSRTEREGLSTDRMQRKPKGNLLGFLKKRK